jgi:hypothetical protein
LREKSECLLLLCSFRNFVNPSGGFCRCVIVVVLCLVAVQGVTAWDVQDLVIKPDGGAISPQTPVTVTCTVHFDSWMTGLTFPAKSTLDLYTDLADPTWVVTITDYERDPPETSPLLEKSGPQVRIDGWTLSYSSRQLDLNVRVRGSAPAVDQTQEKIMIRVQERDSAGQPLTRTAITRKNTIVVPTPATPSPTTPPAIETPASVETTSTIPPVPSTPARKQTWAPGPEPSLICGMLAGVVIVVALRQQR